MWLIVKEKELKAYFEGLRRLVWGNERQSPPQETACPKEPEIRQVLLRYVNVNQSIEIGTEAGTVAGVLQVVGEDNAQLAEAGGTIALIPFRQINFVQVL